MFKKFLVGFGYSFSAFVVAMLLVYGTLIGAQYLAILLNVHPGIVLVSVYGLVMCVIIGVLQMIS